MINRVAGQDPVNRRLHDHQDRRSPYGLRENLPGYK